MRTESENLALFQERQGVIRSVANRLKRVYFAPSTTPEDWDQICFIGGWEAVQGWKPHKGSFESFVNRVMSNHVKRVVKAATTHGRSGMGREIPMSQLTGDEEGEPADFGTECANLKQVEEWMVYESLVERLSGVLSRSEIQALLLRGEGLSYEEIKQLTGLKKKQVDNALTRARKKLRQYGVAPVRNLK